jgi:hypothetical protein
MSRADISFEEFQAISKAANIRPRFSHRYTTPKEDRKKATDKPRLLDLLTYIAPESSADFLAIPNDGEICVVDMVFREKGFFAVTPFISPEQIGAMVRDFFGTPGIRVNTCLWIA